MGSGSIRFGGRPTAPDVQALRDRFGVPVEGESIGYTEIAQVLHCDPKDSRFQTVTNAWRKALERDHNLLTSRGDGKFTVLKPSERVDVAADRLKSGVRRIRKSGEIAARTDSQRLSEADLKRSDHVQRIASALIQQAQMEARRAPKPELPSKN